MNKWAESSRVVMTVRPLARGSRAIQSPVQLAILGIRSIKWVRQAASRVAAGAARAIPILFGGAPLRSSLVMRRMVPAVASPAGGQRGTVANGSRLLHYVEGLLDRAASAWRRSSVRTGLETAFNESPASRVRLGGCVGVAAAITHTALVGIGSVGFGWIAAVPFAAACVWRPEAVIAAWQRSRFATAARRRAR